jgi:hypothetical protein
MFVIEDERHAERQPGEYVSMEMAYAELQRLAHVPWDTMPNKAPCTSWRTCGRTYEIVEYDRLSIPWQELRRVPILDVSASGTIWLDRRTA